MMKVNPEIADDNSLAELLDRVTPKLLDYARGRLNEFGLNDGEDENDLCQWAMLQFLSKVQTGKLCVHDRRHAERLLRMMVRHRVIDRVRRRTTRTRVGAPEVLPCEILDARPDPEPTPLESALRDESLRHALDQLDRDTRRILEQRCAGETWEQIASDRSGNSEAVRKRFERAIHRARDKVGG